MYLPAISIGYAVPAEDFDASIHSVFQSALNLRLSGENHLLTLMAAGEGDLPQGIRLDAPDRFSFEGFPVGEPAVCRDSLLHFENSSLTVQLSGARRWKCDLPALKFDPAIPAVAAAWHLVWDALNKRQRLSGAEIIADDLFGSNESARSSVLSRAGGAMRDLVHAAQRYALTETALKPLIGLGSGLTPSGDDLLVGCLAGLWCTVQDRNERLQFVSSLGQIILPLLAETNEISGTYLYHAVQGQVSSRLVNLAEVICQGKSTEHLLEMAEAAMKVGHTSGMDAVSGMLVGFAAWESDQFFIL
jgi:hypothetical protein